MKEKIEMTTMRKFMLAAAMAAACAVVAAREAPLQDPGKVELAVPSGQTASPAKVRQALVLAGTARGWTVVGDQPGRLKLNFDKASKHRVTVEVSYDARSFDIRYVDSHNLNYAQKDGQPMIHPNYNRWVNNLAHDTRMFYAQAGVAGATPAASAPN
jgi:hypothetical protein